MTVDTLRPTSCITAHTADPTTPAVEDLNTGYVCKVPAEFLKTEPSQWNSTGKVPNAELKRR